MNITAYTVLLLELHEENGSPFRVNPLHILTVEPATPLRNRDARSRVTFAVAGWPPIEVLESMSEIDQLCSGLQISTRAAAGGELGVPLPPKSAANAAPAFTSRAHESPVETSGLAVV